MLQVQAKYWINSQVLDYITSTTSKSHVKYSLYMSFYVQNTTTTSTCTCSVQCTYPGSTCTRLLQVHVLVVYNVHILVVPVLDYYKYMYL